MGLAALDSVAFLIGPVAGPVIAASVWAVVLVSKRTTAVVVATTVLAMAVFASFLAYWGLWGVGFDAADAGRPVPAVVDRVSTLAIAVSSTAVVLLLVLGAVLATGRGARGTHVDARS